VAINRTLNVQKLLCVPHELVAEVEQFRAQTKISSGSEVWRQLIRKGLEAAREERETLQRAKEHQRQFAA
jgi:metal-responsive CopG/Arc/MetJ family transcriptional regulator